MSNDNYALMVDSSAHNSNMSTAGAMAVDVDSGRAFTIKRFRQRRNWDGCATDAKLHVNGGTSTVPCILRKHR